MPAAYFVLHNRITDDDAMQNAYIPKAVETLLGHGAEILVVSEASDVIEGSTDLPRTIVLRFESREKALAWYNSPEYQAVLPIRLGASEGYGVLVDEFQM